MHTKPNSWRHVAGRALRLTFDLIWTQLAQDRLYWSAVVSSVMNYSSDWSQFTYTYAALRHRCYPQKCGYFCTNMHGVVTYNNVNRLQDTVRRVAMGGTIAGCDQRIFCCWTSIPSLGPIQLIPQVNSPGVKLSIILYIVLRLRMSGVMCLAFQCMYGGNRASSTVSVFGDGPRLIW